MQDTFMVLSHIKTCIVLPITLLSILSRDSRCLTTGFDLSPPVVAESPESSPAIVHFSHLLHEEVAGTLGGKRTGPQATWYIFSI